MIGLTNGRVTKDHNPENSQHENSVGGTNQQNASQEQSQDDDDAEEQESD